MMLGIVLIFIMENIMFNKNESDGGLTSEEIDRRNKDQQAEALGDDNMWFAGEKIGHEPSDEEAVRHYIESGGAKDYAERHKKEE